MIYTTGTVSTVSGSAIVSGTGTIILIKMVMLILFIWWTGLIAIQN